MTPFASVPARPRIKRSVDILAGTDGSLRLVRPAAEHDLEILDPPPGLAELLALMDGTRTIPQLAAHGPAAGPAMAREAAGALSAAGLLEDPDHPALAALAPDDLDRYDHQLQYFEEISPPGASGATAQHCLKEASVVVVGLGGLGSWLAHALACSGVGRLELHDGDTVELSNLSRQILYGQADVGQPKAPAARRRLQALNPAIEIRSSDQRLSSPRDLSEAVRGASFVALCADWPPHEIAHWASRACFEHGIPFAGAGITAPLVRIGPTFVPGTTSCLACHEQALREADPSLDLLIAHLAARPSDAPVTAPACALAAGILASDIVHQLTGLAEPSTLGAALTLDLRASRPAIERTPSPGCEECQRWMSEPRNRDVDGPRHASGPARLRRAGS